MKICFVLLLALGFASAFSQEFQTTSTSKVQARIVVKAGPKLDTRRLYPQINPSTAQAAEEVENVFRPPWRDTPSSPNFLKVGGVVPGTSITRDALWPALGATTWVPPDPSLAVGPSDVVEVVNDNVGFFTKSGTNTLTQSLGTFFSGLGATAFLFDPKVFYDRLSGRFVIVCLEKQTTPTHVSKLLVAVSDDSGAAGTWYRYRIEALYVNGTTDCWLDYPGMGYNKDGFFFSGNLFDFNNAYVSGRLLVIPKAAMLTGSAATVNYFLVSGAFSIQPAQTYSPTLDREYLGEEFNTFQGRLHVVTNILSTPVLQSVTFTVPDLVYPTNYATSTSGHFLHPSDGRTLNCMWRDGKLVYCQTVRTSASTVNRARWYEVDTNNYPTNTPTLTQSGEVSDPVNDYFMPAICRNGFGDESIIFTRCSSSIVADCMVAARHQGDAAGTMGTPTLMESSAGATYGGSGGNRWGDYFEVTVDPNDDATFWGVWMDGAASGAWKTSIFSWTVTAPARVSSLGVAPPSVTGGTSATGTVTLTSAAPSLGLVVTLSSANPAAAQVSATVTVPGGATSANFTVTTSPVAADTTFNLSASNNGFTEFGAITVKAPRLDGTVTLGDLAVSPAGRTVTVEVRNPGSTTPLDSYTTTLDAAGHFSVITTRLGTFDVAVKSSHWLRRTTANVSFTAAGATVNPTLVNGDVNGDNSVTLGDFAALRAAYGSSSGGGNWNPEADLNGDGTVTLGDFAILRAHYGQNGDN